MELAPTLAEWILAALVGPSDETVSEIDMWQVVSGIGVLSG